MTNQMKYNVLGFDQQKACKEGLKVTDLLLLRAIIDLFNCTKIVKHQENGITYRWLQYQKMLDELPTLGIATKKGLYKRLQKLVKKGLLLHCPVKNSNGSYSYYAITRKTKALETSIEYTKKQQHFVAIRGEGSPKKDKQKTLLPNHKKNNTKKDDNEQEIKLEGDLFVEQTKEDLVFNEKEAVENNIFEEQFEKFWDTYPRKTGKKPAKEKLKAILKKDKDGVLFEKIMYGVLEYKKENEKQKTEEKYIQHPRTFLNGEKWNDYKSNIPEKLSYTSDEGNSVVEIFNKYYNEYKGQLRRVHLSTTLELSTIEYMKQQKVDLRTIQIAQDLLNSQKNNPQKQ